MALGIDKRQGKAVFVESIRDEGCWQPKQCQHSADSEPRPPHNVEHMNHDERWDAWDGFRPSLTAFLTKQE